MHFIKVAVEHRNALLQVADLLVFGEQLALVLLHVVEEYGAFVLSSPARAHGLLEALEQLIFGLIEVLD